MVGKNLAEDPYEHLANAIILSAVSDYRAALKRVKCNQGSKTAMDEEMCIRDRCKDPGFDGRVVTYDEFISRSYDEGCTDQLA